MNKTQQALFSKCFALSVSVLSLSALFSCNLHLRLDPIFMNAESTAEDTPDDGDDEGDHPGPIIPPAPGYQIIALIEEGIELTWDYEEGQAFAFRIAYRGISENKEDWIVLSTIQDENAREWLLSPQALPRGDWEIGVSAVNSLQEMSAWHSSLDANAYPSSGWVVRN